MFPSISRKILTIVAAIVLLTLSALPGRQLVPGLAPKSAAAAGEPELKLVLRGTSNMRINQLQVRPQRSSNTAAHTQAMHAGSGWGFFDDGTFVFVPNGIGTLVRDDLFPVYGRWEEQNDRIVFSAARQAGNSNARVTFAMRGTVSMANDGTIIVRVVEETSSVMAAVVNNTSYGSNSYKYVDLSLAVTVVR